MMQELPQRVVCKCGTRCYVKILENQWFLNYSDPAWKERTKTLIRAANVYPEQSLEWYFSTIDWLRNWPCARKSGMGTKLPWDKEWIVETLSDSTIYMAFYTISQFVNAETVKFGQLLPEVFDYLLLGKGSEAHVSKLSGIELKVLKAMRNEFSYWYPVDLRNSAKELIPNHLTFFAFHHAALFEQKHWPRGFSVNGMIQIEGQKMSKSRNVFVTWRHALEQYGADGLRATLALAADGMDDADWKAKNAEDISAKIDSLFPFIEKALAASTEREPELSDRWLLSVVHGRIETRHEVPRGDEDAEGALRGPPRRLERHPLVPEEGGEAAGTTPSSWSSRPGSAWSRPSSRSPRRSSTAGWGTRGSSRRRTGHPWWTSRSTRRRRSRSCWWPRSSRTRGTCSR